MHVVIRGKNSWGETDRTARKSTDGPMRCWRTMQPDAGLNTEFVVQDKTGFGGRQLTDIEGNSIDLQCWVARTVQSYTRDFGQAGEEYAENFLVASSNRIDAVLLYPPDARIQTGQTNDVQRATLKKAIFKK